MNSKIFCFSGSVGSFDSVYSGIYIPDESFSAMSDFSGFRIDGEEFSGIINSVNKRYGENELMSQCVAKHILTEAQLIQGIQASCGYLSAEYPSETTLMGIEILHQEQKVKRLIFKGTCLVQMPDFEPIKASFDAEILADRRFRVTSFKPIGS